jgi:PEP-CTERM motif-containing protein
VFGFNFSNGEEIVVDMDSIASSDSIASLSLIPDGSNQIFISPGNPGGGLVNVVITQESASVSEPTSITLFGSGFAGLLAFWRKGRGLLSFQFS